MVRFVFERTAIGLALVAALGIPAIVLLTACEIVLDTIIASGPTGMLGHVFYGPVMLAIGVILSHVAIAMYKDVFKMLFGKLDAEYAKMKGERDSWRHGREYLEKTSRREINDLRTENHKLECQLKAMEDRLKMAVLPEHAGHDYW